MRAAGHGDSRRVSASGEAGRVPVPGTAGVLVRWEARWDPADLGAPGFRAASYVVLEPPWGLDPGKGWMADGGRLVELAAAAGVAAEASAWEAHLRALCRRAGIDRGAVSRMADALEVLRG